MTDIAAVMITVDRSPQENYLRQTLENLTRENLLGHDRLIGWPGVSCPIFISDSGDGDWAAAITDELGLSQSHVCVNGHVERVCANLNVAHALQVGAAFPGAKWVLFLEDDIDVCANFFDSVGAWLDDYGDGGHLVYPLAAGYRWVDAAVSRGESAHTYPVHQFYGTQAFALLRDDARDLADFIEADLYRKNPEGVSWDLIMHDWAAERGVSHFLTPCPSFAQHIGRESVVNPRPKTHQFASWPGREWSYKPDRKRASA